MPDNVLSPEAIEALIEEHAVDVPPLLVAKTSITSGIYIAPHESRDAVDTDVYIALVVVAYDAESDTLVRLPLLLDRELAGEILSTPAEDLDALVGEAVAIVNNTEDSAQ